MKYKTFEELPCWQKARELCQAVFDLINNSKIKNDFSLRDQIWRASGSTMDNTAEGFDDGSTAEFIRFLGYSQRSCSEIQSQLYVALDQNYFDNNTFNDLYELASYAKSKVGAFIKYLKQNPR